MTLIGAPPRASAATWKVASIPTPHTVVATSFDTVSCPTNSACLAIGGRWNGRAWSVAPSPWTVLPVQDDDVVSEDISCVSNWWCMAVAAIRVSASGDLWTLAAAVWNGFRWTLETPNDAGSFGVVPQVRVSCASSTLCVLVSGFASEGFMGQPGAQEWNGSGWSTMSLPSLGSDSTGSLNGVSCSSNTSCVAVGADQVITGTPGVVPLAESWNGSAWSLMSTPTPGAATGSGLSSVACPSATACVAVRSESTASGTTAFSETLSGSSWSLEPLAVPSGAATIAVPSVSCQSSRACWAVGHTGAAASDGAPVAEAWDGTRWSLGTPLTPAGASGTALSDVSCASTKCMATGTSVNGAGTISGLTELVSATGWQIEATPQVDQSLTGDLGGIACSSRSSCVAVGYSDAGSGGAAELIGEQWNGSQWTLQLLPNPAGTMSAELDAVACTASGAACAAVGDDGDGHPLAEEFNGTSWSLESIPNPAGGTRDTLTGVGCTSATACTAVGSYVESDAYQMLAEHWNGTAWSLESLPVPAATVSSDLAGITCPTSTFCMALGSYLTSGGGGGSLIDVWNGTAWSVGPAPAPGNLDGISCSAASACTVVGEMGDSSGGTVSLAERWNGTAWSQQPTQTGAYGDLQSFAGVSCSTARRCEAVGHGYDTDYLIPEPLAEGWNGSSWSLQTTPAGPGELNSVACPTSTLCFAAGNTSSTGEAGSGAPLIEQYG